MSDNLNFQVSMYRIMDADYLQASYVNSAINKSLTEDKDIQKAKENKLNKVIKTKESENLIVEDSLSKQKREKAKGYKEKNKGRRIDRLA